MIRLVQARLTDTQYDWLAERAIVGHDRDLSKAVRESVELARLMIEILDASDRHAALDEVIERSRQELEKQPELYMDRADHQDEQ